ncbi:MAG: hypothetical protein NVS2B14_14090 [Chamaesiphon sp.]
MMLTTIVVALAGTGLVIIMNANIKAEEEISRQTELNRALDFITDEVRMSQSITSNASGTIYGFRAASGATNIQKVLVLNLPASTGVTAPIVYYIASPPSISPWSGPKVIYRWGPTLSDSGEYSDPARSYNDVVVDFIDDSTPNPNSDCSTSWYSNPTNKNDRTGFYTCVDPTGKLIQLYLRGKLTHAPKSYLVSSTVFGRSTSSSPSGGSSGGGNTSGGGSSSSSSSSSTIFTTSSSSSSSSYSNTIFTSSGNSSSNSSSSTIFTSGGSSSSSHL